MPDKVDEIEIPFEEHSNLIVVPVTINGFLTLKFILDTGAESAILTEKVFGDILRLNYVREMTVMGPGMVDSLRAFVATDIRMSLPGGLKADGLNMLVLKEDYLELNKNLGEEIFGIIGYDLFHRFIINIDYDNKKLVIHRPEAFRPRRSATMIPLEITQTKPYMQVTIGQNDQRDTVKLMVDSGASHALLLDVRNIPDIVLPEKLVPARLGQGLGGEIPGFLGRMSFCHLGDFSFNDMLVSIPIEGAYIKAIKRGSRHGTFGGDLLSRFNVTFDYLNQKIYLQKGSHYNDPFEFDMSGLVLAAEGKKLDSIVVSKVRKNTPADSVGILAGDVLYKINGKFIYDTNISEVNALLRKKDGLKIRLKLFRDGQKFKKVFRLKRTI